MPDAGVPQHITVIQQDCPLLRLPGEIKNRIFELAIPNGTTILASARRLPREEGKFAYQFYPALPPISAVCRQVRAEAMPQYYANNTFHLADTIFKPHALQACIAGRMPAIVHIHNARATLWCIAHEAMLSFDRRQMQQVVLTSTRPFRLSFRASMDDRGVHLDWLEARGTEKVVDICCCTMRMSRSRRKDSPWQQYSALTVEQSVTFKPERRFRTSGTARRVASTVAGSWDLEEGQRRDVRQSDVQRSDRVAQAEGHCSEKFRSREEALAPADYRLRGKLW